MRVAAMNPYSDGENVVRYCHGVLSNQDNKARPFEIDSKFTVEWDDDTKYQDTVGSLTCSGTVICSSNVNHCQACQEL